MTDMRKSLMQLIDDRMADGEPVGADMAAVMQVLRSYAEADEMAPRVQRAVLPLDAGEWLFDRPFKAMPSVQIALFQEDGEPVAAVLSDWIMDSEQYAGVRFRASANPQGAQVHLSAGSVA